MKLDMIDSADAQERNGGSSTGYSGVAWDGSWKSDVGGGECKEKTKSEDAGEEMEIAECV